MLLVLMLMIINGSEAKAIVTDAIVSNANINNANVANIANANSNADCCQQSRG